METGIFIFIKPSLKYERLQQSEFETRAKANTFLLHEVSDSSKSSLWWVMGGGTLNSLLSLPPSHHLLRLNKIKILFQHRGTSDLQLSCRRININIDFFLAAWWSMTLLNVFLLTRGWWGSCYWKRKWKLTQPIKLGKLSPPPPCQPAPSLSLPFLKK